MSASVEEVCKLVDVFNDDDESSESTVCDRMTYNVRKRANIMVIKRGLRNWERDGNW